MDRLSALARRLHRGCPGLELRRNEPMSRHTTFRIGGPAALMALPRTAEEAKTVLKTAAELNIEPFFLGNGSNLLAADGGYPGFVVKPAGELEEIRASGRVLEAGCAALLSRLSKRALELDLTGLEFAQGIPGSVGGAVTMNAGAYGGETARVLESVTVLERDGSVRELPAAECGFGYRRSIFSDGHALILKARFRLEQGDGCTIKARMDELAAKRREKQPLEYPSAGSAFKRPEGHFAAALIDGCGLKGLTVGGAQVSEKHAGFIVNRGEATCADVLELIRRVKERVLAATGVELETEIRFLGE